MNTITLKPAKDKSLVRRHPWIYANAIEHVDGKPAPGATVVVRSHDGRFLARASFSPHSQIRARVWSFDEAEPIDHAFFKRRVQRAIAHRAAMIRDTGATRLIFGEADGLPGLIVDYYIADDDTQRGQLVCQFMATGVEAWKEAIVNALAGATGCPNVYERSDVSIRQKEGLEQTTGVLAGDPPPDTLIANECGVRYHVDVKNGHKTGFYVDQRDNRVLVAEHARDRDVLNCFCYTGGFSIAALAGGARSALSIDSSAEALALAALHVKDNSLDEARVEWRDADVFSELRKLRDSARSFDLIVLDPPKFAPAAHHVERATRAYKDANLLALKLLRRGGLLATFSCSGGISADLFQKIVAGAALDARADAAIVGRFGPSADHPVALDFPEGDYLKGLLISKRA
jgi:23S rRNA (cytosine1962-C5)-methyltransferase